MKKVILDEYHNFMNKHVLNPIGVDYYNLLENGLAFEVTEKNNIMTQEEKELLLKDLCARLPYGVIVRNIRNREKCQIDNYHPRGVFDFDISPISAKSYNYQGYSCNIEDIKSYLRPMSSMTKEEREYLKELSEFKCTPDKAMAKIDFYLSHHLDYRGLIPMGLALEAPEGMYK